MAKCTDTSVRRHRSRYKIRFSWDKEFPSPNWYQTICLRGKGKESGFCVGLCDLVMVSHSDTGDVA